MSTSNAEPQVCAVAAAAERQAEQWLHQLYQSHAATVRQSLARLVGPGVDVDDLLHETFLVALRRRSALVDEAGARPWLVAIAVRVAAGARRRAKVRRWLGLEAAEHVESQSNPMREFERAEAAREVYAALEHLSEKKRTVLVLYELQGLSGEEIAAVIHCPLKTVWSRLLHARRELEEQLLRHRAKDVTGGVWP